MDSFIVKNEEHEGKVFIENNSNNNITNINVKRDNDIDFNLIADQSKVINQEPNLISEIMDTDVSDDDNIIDKNISKYNINTSPIENNFFNQKSDSPIDLNLLNSPINYNFQESTKSKTNNSELNQINHNFEVNPNNNHNFEVNPNNNHNFEENSNNNHNFEERINNELPKNNDMADLLKPEDFDNNNNSKEFIFKSNNNSPVFNLNSPINYNNASPIVRNLEEQKIHDLRQPIPEKKTHEEIYKEKRDILFQFKRLKKKGINIPKFNIDSDIELMKEELESIKREISLESSCQFYENGLMFFVSLVEFSNKKMNFGLHLDNFTAHVEDQKTQYTPIWEELHDKYSDAPSMPPEVKLIVTLISSAAVFHFTNSLASQNSPMVNMFSGNSNMMNSFNKNKEEETKPSNMNDRINNRLNKTNNQDSKPIDRKMSGPEGVEDILAEIAAEKEKYLNKTVNDNVSESGSGDSYSLISGSEYGTKKKVKRRKNKKPEFNLNI
jgi:hypothetical protein